MRIKKSYRKKLNSDKEKENSSVNNGKFCTKVKYKRRHIFMLDSENLNLEVLVENSTDSYMNNSYDHNMIQHNEYLPTIKDLENILSSYSTTNEDADAVGVNSDVIGNHLCKLLFLSWKNNILRLDLSLSGGQGEKRVFEDSVNEGETNKRFESANDTIVNDILILEQKYIELETKVKKLEGWMCM